jgi:hypothetical protein
MIISHSTNIVPLDAAQQMLDTKSAARVLSLSHRTLEQWRWLGQGPRYFKVRRQVRYRLSDLIAFLERNPHDPESALAA